ncbi:hypothetical protein Taro_029564 [Colocasia esculenta]|uniref:MIR domain-containing protein n=1 Tax=Colocasia esculenta TaxID=4460 RepID=A0A843VXK0_COLES|nr:hypothetical protein [Colocasia esculenta]
MRSGKGDSRVKLGANTMRRHVPRPIPFIHVILNPRVISQFVVSRRQTKPSLRPCTPSPPRRPPPAERPVPRKEQLPQGADQEEEAEEEEDRRKKRAAAEDAPQGHLPVIFAGTPISALEGRPGGAVASPGPQGLSRRKIAGPTSPTPAAASSNSAAKVSAGLREPKRRPPPRDFPFWQQTWFLVLLLLMALASFALAAFIFLGLQIEEGSPIPSFAAAPTTEGVEITYGTVLKLMHERTKFRLHSHDVPYGSGSGQQSVTGFPNVDDSNSYWIVRPVPDSSAKQGDVIKSGTVIQLQHMRTRKWLHSHLHASPISGNLEGGCDLVLKHRIYFILHVSCFGGDGQSDTGDHWRLEIEGSGKTWKQDQRVRLQHIDTGGYLHSHDKKYSRIAGGQQEVCGVREKRPDNVWLAAEGVYLPVNTGK